MVLDPRKNGGSIHPEVGSQSPIPELSDRDRIMLDRAFALGQQSGTSGKPEEPDDDDEEEISLQKIFAFLKRRAWIMASVGGLSALGLLSMVMTSPPSYVGTFRLLAEPVTSGSQLAEDLTADAVQSNQASTRRAVSSAMDNSKIDYVSQIEVLKSETTLDPIVKRIQKQYPKIDYSVLVGSMQILRPKESKVLDFTYASRNPDEIDFVLKELSAGFIRYSIDDRRSNLKEGTQFIENQIQKQRREVETLENRLSVLRQRYNLVDPKTVVDRLADQMKSMTVAQSENRIKLASVQSLYDNLKKQTGVAPQQAVALANLSESPSYQSLLTKLREIDTKIALESTRFSDTTPMMQALQAQRKELLPVLQKEAQRIMGVSDDQSTSPEALGFQGGVGRDLTKQLVDAANQLQILTNQSQVIQQTIAQNGQQTQNIAGISLEYTKVIRDIDIATNSLTRLLLARENLQLESARQAAPWQLLSKIDDRSIGLKGSKPMMMLLSLIASGVIGLAAALIAEQLDRVFHDVEELKETNLPTLGIIPFYTGLKQETAFANVGRLALQVESPADRKSQQSHAAFLEAFYTLDANLRLLGSDHPIQSITVTSASPADGKSSISSHLAWAAVAMGRKVLIIDTDLRRPQVHRWFGIANLRGLSNVITSDADIHDLIQESLQDPNLSVLTAGPMPPAPGRLLSSNKMRSLILSMTEEYDLVICDAPPTVFADAKLTAANTDGVLIVVGVGKTDRAQVLQALTDLKGNAQAPVLGIVANGVKSSASASSYYYQRYYEQKPEKKKSSLFAPKKLKDRV
jgi:polysaccharide biosynthesis transport protein